MTEESARKESTAAGVGCALLVMGVVGGAFGAAALLGISDKIALEFFGIELNDRKGRLLWVAGCIVFAAAGVLLLRKRRAA